MKLNTIYRGHKLCIYYFHIPIVCDIHQNFKDLLQLVLLSANVVQLLIEIFIVLLVPPDSQFLLYKVLKPLCVARKGVPISIVVRKVWIWTQIDMVCHPQQQKGAMCFHAARSEI